MSGNRTNCGHCGTSGALGASVLAAMSRSSVMPAELKRSIVSGFIVRSPHALSES
jgi:hypothetical protein